MMLRGLGLDPNIVDSGSAVAQPIDPAIFVKLDPTLADPVMPTDPQAAYYLGPPIRYASDPILYFGPRIDGSDPVAYLGPPVLAPVVPPVTPAVTPTPTVINTSLPPVPVTAVPVASPGIFEGLKAWLSPVSAVSSATSSISNYQTSFSGDKLAYTVGLLAIPLAAIWYFAGRRK